MEAHATDEWPVGITAADLENGDPVHLRQATSIEDRVKALKALQRDIPLGSKFRYFIDTISNSFNSSYASWPFRCWIIDEKQKIAFKSHPPSTGVAEELNVNQLSQWLHTYERRTVSLM